MATKHINDKTWAQVEKKLVEAVVETKTSMKDSEILKLLIEVGIKNVKKEDYWDLAKNKAV